MWRTGDILHTFLISTPEGSKVMASPKGRLKSAGRATLGTELVVG